MQILVRILSAPSNIKLANQMGESDQKEGLPTEGADIVHQIKILLPKELLKRKK